MNGRRLEELLMRSMNSVSCIFMGWEGLETRVTCNRDELSYVDEDAAE